MRGKADYEYGHAATWLAVVAGTLDALVYSWLVWPLGLSDALTLVGFGLLLIAMAVTYRQPGWVSDAKHRFRADGLVALTFFLTGVMMFVYAALVRLGILEHEAGDVMAILLQLGSIGITVILIRKQLQSAAAYHREDIIE